MYSLLRAMCLALSSTVLIAAPAMAEPPPIAAFFKRPTMRDPQLSPNGRYLAIQTAGKGGDHLLLAVIDLETLGPPKIVAAFADADVAGHRWVNDSRLVFQASETPDQEIGLLGNGLWGVDRDGSNYRQLIQSDSGFVAETSGSIADRRLEAIWQLAGLPHDGTDEVLVTRGRWSNEPETTSRLLARLDTRTGRTRLIANDKLPPSVYAWHLDWRGEPRAVSAASRGRTTVYRRDDQGHWAIWTEGDTNAFEGFRPYWFGPEDLTLVRGSYNGFDAIYKLDAKTGKPEDKPLFSFKGYDYDGRVVYDPATGRLLGLKFETDAPNTLWMDPQMKAHQADIDAKLRGGINEISCTRCIGEANFVVTTLSDQAPPSYWLYKTADKSLQPLVPPRADLPAREMGQRDIYRFKARDGLEVPLLVTMPPGPKKPRPAVLMVHGGPFVRGTHWQWDAEAQFLASRGYVVLEPEFRGSEGYGYRHFHAGWKQWGLAMQDDLADTLGFAVKQGWVDPARVCIAGASYGGYAALMGAIQQADLFKCAINWVGVTDLTLMASINWSDMSDDWKRYGMKQLVGDPVADAAQFAATSPLKRAREIKIPLLMAYGGTDRRVPIKHGTELKAAMSPSQPLEWVDYPNEGHGWFNLKTNEDFWGRVARFLGKHLAAPQ